MINQAGIITLGSPIISQKEIITSSDGEQIVDFFKKNYSIDFFDRTLDLIAVFIVKEEHLCRLDLISFQVYGDASYAPLLAKWNKITNPFSMEVNDLIICPTTQTMDKFYTTDPSPTKKSATDAKSLWLDPQRATKQDIKRIEQLKKIAFREKNGSMDPKPTNLLREGEVPFVKEGGTITLAPYTNPNT